jgi:hypothetical protein
VGGGNLGALGRGNLGAPLSWHIGDNLSKGSCHWSFIMASAEQFSDED